MASLDNDGRKGRMVRKGIIPKDVWNDQHDTTRANIVRPGAGYGVSRSIAGTVLELQSGGYRPVRFEVSVAYDATAGGQVIWVDPGLVLLPPQPGGLENWRDDEPTIGGTALSVDPRPNLGAPVNGYNAVYARFNLDLEGTYQSTVIIHHTDSVDPPVASASEYYLLIAGFDYDSAAYETDGLRSDLSNGIKTDPMLGQKVWDNITLPVGSAPADPNDAWEYYLDAWFEEVSAPPADVGTCVDLWLAPRERHIVTGQTRPRSQPQVRRLTLCGTQPEVPPDQGSGSAGGAYIGDYGDLPEWLIVRFDNPNRAPLALKAHSGMYVLSSFGAAGGGEPDSLDSVLMPYDTTDHSDWRFTVRREFNAVERVTIGYHIDPDSTSPVGNYIDAVGGDYATITTATEAEVIALLGGP